MEELDQPKGSTPADFISVIGGGGDENRYAFAPSIYAAFVLRAVFNQMGFTVKGSLWDDDDFNELMIVSNRPLDERGGDDHAETGVEGGIGGLNWIPNYIDFSSKSPDDNWGAESFTQAKILDPGSTRSASADYYIAQADGIHRISPQGVSLTAVVPYGAFMDFETESCTITASIQLWAGSGIGSNQLVHTWEGENSSLNVNSLGFVWLIGPQLDLEVYEGFFSSGDRFYFLIEITAVHDTLSTVQDVEPYGQFMNFTIENLSTAGINVFKKSFNIQDHLPDVSVSSLLNSIKSIFNVKIDYDLANSVVMADKVEKVLGAGLQVDWSSKLISPVGIEFNQGKKFRFAWKKDDVEEDYFESSTDQTAQSISTISPDFSPLLQEQITDATHLTPQTQSMIKGSFKAISEFYELGSSEPLKRLVFVGGNAGRSFAMRWSPKKPNQPTIISVNYNLSLELMASADAHQMDFNLTLDDIQSLTSATKILVNHVEYMWEEIQVGYGKGKINRASAKLLKLSPKSN